MQFEDMRPDECAQVRKRVHVTGERGVVLHGGWTMDSSVGGGTFENVTCITSCGQGDPGNV